MPTSALCPTRRRARADRVDGRWPADSVTSTVLTRTSWLGGRGSGSCSAESRKVRTSQSRVIANGNPRRLAGKCHRKQTATFAVVRVKRCGKSAPAFRVTGVARQTPPEARSRRPHSGAVAQVSEGCSPEPAGRPLEAPGDGVSRWMVAAASPGDAEQNPAYRPTRPPRQLDKLRTAVSVGPAPRRRRAQSASRDPTPVARRSARPLPAQTPRPAGLSVTCRAPAPVSNPRRTSSRRRPTADRIPGSSARRRPRRRRVRVPTHASAVGR